MLAPRHASRPWRKTPAVFIVVASLQTAGAHRATEMFQRLLQLRSPRGRARYATLFMRRFAPNRLRRCCSLNRVAMRPDKIHGEAKKNQAESESAVTRRCPDLVARDGSRGDERDGRSEERRVGKECRSRWS